MEFGLYTTVLNVVGDRGISDDDDDDADDDVFVAESLSLCLCDDDIHVQAFVVIAVYNMTRMKVALIPLIVRLWIESKVAVRRAKVANVHRPLRMYTLVRTARYGVVVRASDL